VEHFADILSFLALPMLACLILTGSHCYMGIHILMREVLFVDLALAQVAALGAAVGAVVGLEVSSVPNYFFALGFTLIGAALFAMSRFRDRRIPQEAVIGIVYAVCAGAAVLVLSKSTTEGEEIEQMLTGRLLFIGWPEIIKTTAIYIGIFLIHARCAKRFFAMSQDEDFHGAHDRLWDFLFYATFGIMVTSSVKMAGVLLVFCYLIIPASCAMLFFRTVTSRLITGWLLGLLGSAAGLTIVAIWDFPVGPAIVGVFGVIFILFSTAYALGLGARPAT